MNKPKKTKKLQPKKARNRTAERLHNQIDKLHLKILGLEQDQELNEHDQELRKAEVDRLLNNVKVAYEAGETFQKKIAQLDREKSNLWDNLSKAEKEIIPMREILEFCVKCLDDFKNRHLVVCHQCDSEAFRFKNISIATDFERLLAKLAPYRQKRTSLDYVRMAGNPPPMPPPAEPSNQ